MAHALSSTSRLVDRKGVRPSVAGAEIMRAGLPTDESFGVNPWIMSAVRRFLDITVAAFALLILLPAMLLIMLLVRVSSRGPVFFRQRRTGRDREEFTLYKFRSMRLANTSGPAITVSGDSRITPIGVFLRRYKLDELPQFWNVLKGNMS